MKQKQKKALFILFLLCFLGGQVLETALAIVPIKSLINNFQDEIENSDEIDSGDTSNSEEKENKERRFKAVLDFEGKEVEAQKNNEENIDSALEEREAAKRRKAREEKLEKIKKIEGFFKKYQGSILEDLYQRILSTKDEIGKIENKRKEEEENRHKIDKKSKKSRQAVLEKIEKIDTLQGQMKSLNRSITVSVNKIRNVKKQIAEIQANIEVLTKRISQKEVELKIQKELLSDFVRAIYREESQFYDFSSSKIEIVKIVLSDASVGEVLREKNYLSKIENIGRDIFAKLEKIKSSLEIRNKELATKYVSLEHLEKKLEDEYRMMSNLKEARMNLLERTKNDKNNYQELYEKSRLEKMAANREIEMLVSEKEKNIKLLSSLKERKKESEELLKTFDVKAQKAFSSGILVKDKNASINWPVDPSKGISAYYHDEAYKEVFSMRHDAIDIRVPQGTEIVAPAKSYVLRTKDNGLGYSYIVLAHPNDYFTVYGHVSKFFVKEGDLLNPGDIIGLSGGTPGSKGAGWMTTGPHLHFEIYKGGEHIDPLAILPLTKLPLKYIPEKWFFRLDIDAHTAYWEKKLVKRK